MQRLLQHLRLASIAVFCVLACRNAQSSELVDASSSAAACREGKLDAALVGHWKLQGDCRDYSGQKNHGVNHRVDLENGLFDGTGAYIEVPSHPSLQLGTGDFAICARIHTEGEVNDILGDVLEKYDPKLRRGITLWLK